MNHLLSRPLPEKLKPLADLALDLRWSGSQTAARIWERLDPETWERTRNAHVILLNVHQDRLDEAAQDEALLRDLQHLLDRMRRHDSEASWFDSQAGSDPRPLIAYFSMEFGLSEALPIYSGGLGMLAADHLKSSSSLAVPLIGIGLLYQQGYFRQVIADDGSQIAVHPYNEPGSLPITKVEGPDGRWPRVRLELPGRTLMLRVWEARVGRVRLLLLDSNDPMNSPNDRAITAQLYNANRRTRLLQELVLGVGGWRLLEKLGLQADVCHLNEGHAAFAVIARAVDYAQKERVTFDTALWATRAGNVFTTHTPVAAAFDEFDPTLIREYAAPLAAEAGIGLDELLALGRDGSERFNMAFLAMRGCARVNGVSRLHGEVSRRLFGPLFPQWPYSEVPVTHITNGIHVPTWDSTAANLFWKKGYAGTWSRHLEDASSRLAAIPDEELWFFRNDARTTLVEYVREKLIRRSRERGLPHADHSRCATVLDPQALTIGFARRFTGYKRPTLLLHDPERLAAILNHTSMPVQLLIAGKAHQNDGEGQAMVREVARFCMRPDVCDRAIFLEDYDMAVAQALTGGVDIWLNNPQRPCEACGTSGMKALVNGGLHFSTLDGWWDEAYAPDVGWAIGDHSNGHESSPDADAQDLYRLLESEIVPEFYTRDESGLPRRWLERMRASMTKLTPVFSSNRMVREYALNSYLPAARQYRHRTAGRAAIARDLQSWHARMALGWKDVHFAACNVQRILDDGWHFEVDIVLGGLDPDAVCVQLYCEDTVTGAATPIPMHLKRRPAHAGDSACYVADAPANRPVEHYTPRVTASHPEAATPLEAPFILWQK